MGIWVKLRVPGLSMIFVGNRLLWSGHWVFSLLRGCGHSYLPMTGWGWGRKSSEKVEKKPSSPISFNISETDILISDSLICQLVQNLREEKRGAIHCPQTST